MRPIVLIFICSLLCGMVWAQPEPCNPDAMTSTCLDACVVCDINGFTGRNDLTVQGQTFLGFCTTRFHNMSYIAFIAGTENLTINVSVTNCMDGDGIEVGIFESLDCETFTPITDCNTDVPANGNATFSNLVPLVVGQHYYLIMDGSRGDICDWTFNVIDGSTVVGDLTSSGMIEGPEETCPQLPITYFTTGEVGATIFNWTLNGVAQNGNTPEVDITFPSDGTYQLCVTASNVCDEAPPICRTINVVSLEPTNIVETLCANSCIEVAGETVCESGMYEYMLPLSNGCDSMIFLDLNVLPELTSFVNINLCIGETFMIGTTPYTTTGVFIETIASTEGCDSTVTLDLNMIDCELAVTIDFTTPICNEDENGALIISVQNGIPPFTYEWNNINDATIGGVGSINLLTDILIENIPAGSYEINIIDSFGNAITFMQEVLDPSLLTATINAIDYNGFNLSCYNADDGSATVVASGGVAPYSYMWTNNETQATISDLSAGRYEVEITDSNGCALQATVNLTGPELLEFAVNYIDPNCDGPTTGMIQLDFISGGSPPYTFALDENPYIMSDVFQNLGSGNYDFSAQDANGCFADTSGSLFAPAIPILFMDDDQEIDLGCSVLITAQTNNTSLMDIQWTNIDNALSCDSCLETYATPVNDTEYILTLTSIDNCSTSDSIFVKVNKTKGVYIPNAFSPNDDGINDRLFVNANKSVSIIKTFKVFNRWGTLMFEERDLAPNQASSGWDGYFKGEAMDNGVYVWMAEVEYLDGTRSVLSGDATIIK